MRTRSLSSACLLLGLAIAPIAADEPAELAGESCTYGRARAEAAVLRARRSVARTNIAVLRVASELRRAGITPVRVPGVEALEAPSGAPVGEAATFEELAAGAWGARRYAERLGGLAEDEMERLERPLPASAGLAAPFDVDEEAAMRPEPGDPDLCLAWAKYTERGAFRAEQAAQLAEIAADQAIALADFELRRRDR